jgi:ATP-dependent DNA helicase RecG
MDVKELKQIINQGENSFVEFSKCTTELTDSVFQSICSFLNKDGGTLIVGVHDFGKIVGVAEIFVNNMLRRFSDAVEKEFAPAVALVPEVIVANDKKVLYVNVPSSPEVHRYKNKVYDRVVSEVCDITYSYNLVENLYLRKRNESSENIVCPFLRMADLEETAFRVMRKAITVSHPAHPWLKLTNEELLHSAGFWRRDPISKKEGFVLAAVLLFGKEVTIQNYSPITYRTDAIYRNVSYERFSQPASDYPESRYDDRDIIFSNLIDSYARLMKFVQRNLPKRILNKGTVSVNIREKLFGEVVTNFLAHREYTHKYPSRLLIFSDKVITENGSSPLVAANQTFETLEPVAKNPLITKVFQAMGWIEGAGSGRTNILKYAPFYDQTFEVEIQNTEKFVFAISYGKAEGLDDLALMSSRPAPSAVGSPPSKVQIEWPMYASRLSKACPGIDISYIDKAESILEACVKPLPIQDMMRMVKQSNRTRFRQNIIRPLLEEGLLAMRIPMKPSSPLQKYFTTEKGKALL